MSQALVFLDKLAARLSGSGNLQEWNTDNLAAHLRPLLNNYPSGAGMVQIGNIYNENDNLDEVPNARMIHEMLKRGFAAMKIPEERFDAQPE